MKTRRLAILVAVAVIALSASGCGYNTLTTKRENVKGKWAGIEAQLQRRADLINNLVESAKLAGIQEQEVFGAIAQARSRLLNATGQAPQGEAGDKSPEQKQAVIDAANSFGGTIGRLLVLQENYPVLKSNENFLKLQDEVAGTENRIATARNDYNGAVQEGVAFNQLMMVEGRRVSAVLSVEEDVRFAHAPPPPFGWSPSPRNRGEDL